MTNFDILCLISQEIINVSGINGNLETYKSNGFTTISFDWTKNYLRLHVLNNKLNIHEVSPHSGTWAVTPTRNRTTIDIADPNMINISINKIVEWGYCK